MRFDAVERLRRAAFASASRDPRIGAEIELLSLDAERRTPVSVQGRLLPFLRAWVSERGGVVRTGPKGGVRVALPDGSGFAIEPGGQLEFASAPCRSPSALLGALRHILHPLVRSAAEAGIDLVGLGIDPHNDPGLVPLQIIAERYCRMDAYFESIGPAGRRMMRQTAAVQVNVDAAGPAPIAWNACNAAAPYLIALFANSRRYAGRDTGFASYRAETWRRADPLRTGVFERDADPAVSYARFALDAPVMHPGADGSYRPFHEWLRRGEADEALWEDHLTTLFPEVRPKRWLEIRSIDGQPVDALELPILVCAGITMDARAAAAAADLLAPADPELLAHAGRVGLADPTLAARSRDLVDLALGACRTFCAGDDIDRAWERAVALMNADGRSAQRADRPLSGSVAQR